MMQTVHQAVGVERTVPVDRLARHFRAKVKLAVGLHFLNFIRVAPMTFFAITTSHSSLTHLEPANHYVCLMTSAVLVRPATSHLIAIQTDPA